MLSINYQSTDTIKLFLSNHSQRRFEQRFNCICDIDYLNNIFDYGYILQKLETRVYFPQNNMLISVDNKELPSYEYVVKTFIPRHAGKVYKENGVKVNIVWDVLI